MKRYVFIVCFFAFGCDRSFEEVKSREPIDIICEIPGGVVKTYKTRERFPMFRGSFSFETTDDVRVMNTRCHIEIR